jgi:hypothetical protein
MPFPSRWRIEPEAKTMWRELFMFWSTYDQHRLIRMTGAASIGTICGVPVRAQCP